MLLCKSFTSVSGGEAHQLQVLCRHQHHPPVAACGSTDRVELGLEGCWKTYCIASPLIFQHPAMYISLSLGSVHILNRWNNYYSSGALHRRVENNCLCFVWNLPPTQLHRLTSLSVSTPISHGSCTTICWESTWVNLLHCHLHIIYLHSPSDVFCLLGAIENCNVCIGNPDTWFLPLVEHRVVQESIRYYGKAVCVFETLNDVYIHMMYIFCRCSDCGKSWWSCRAHNNSSLCMPCLNFRQTPAMFLMHKISSITAVNAEKSNFHSRTNPCSRTNFKSLNRSLQLEQSSSVL